MSTAPLQQAIAATRGVLANVTADQLQNASPCDSWDVAGVINHVVGQYASSGRHEGPTTCGWRHQLGRR